MDVTSFNHVAAEESDHVRENTPDAVNAKIDRETEDSLHYWAARSRAESDRRITELDREWDVERYLEMTASSFALTGVIAGLVTRKKGPLVFSAVVLSFLFQHAVQGWCPPLPVFRRLGVRTRKEIDREKYALRVQRGDFG